MTSSLSSPGVGSGLDVKGIVDKLVAIEHRPVDVLAAHQKSVQTKISSFGLVKNFMANLKDAASTLAGKSLWTATSATSSNASVATAASVPAGHAAAGRYQLRVKNLAQAQTLVSAPTRDSKANLGAGVLHIELGTWPPADGAFEPKSGATPVTVVLPESPSSLEAVRDRINASAAGVNASILRDSNGARLIVKSLSTGEENGARITAEGPHPGEDPPESLAALTYDPPQAGGMSRAQAARDASATLNGVPVSSPDNVLDGAIDGVTITLQKASDDPVDIAVSPDSAAMKKALTAFVGAYNDLAQYMAAQTKYDAASKTAAPLQGDPTMLQLQKLLRNALSTASGASAALPRLLDVGIHLDASNSLAIDGAKLDKALSNPQELAKAFANRDPDGATNDGFGVRFAAIATKLLAPDSPLSQHGRALDDSVARYRDLRAKMEDRVSQYQDRVLKSYTALDTKMAQLRGQSAYVSQQMSMLSKSGSK